MTGRKERKKKENGKERVITKRRDEREEERKKKASKIFYESCATVKLWTCVGKCAVGIPVWTLAIMIFLIVLLKSCR